MNKVLLIVEDDAILNKALREIMSELNIDVVVAKDGEEGLEKAKKEKPDLILLDILMPKKDGVEVLKEIRGSSEIKDTKVYVLTVVTDKEKISKCVELGISGYFIKSNYTLEEIQNTVKTALDL